MRRTSPIGSISLIGLIGLLAVGAAREAPPRHVVENSLFRVVVPAGREALADSLMTRCLDARRAIGEHCDSPPAIQVEVHWCETEDEFQKATGWRTESVVAAASARRGRVWISGPAWKRADPRETIRVLVHEYAHVMVGRLVSEPLPRWADEGLAMHLAGDWGFGEGFAASRAQLFGGLPGLASIEREFPPEGDPLHRAYLASYLAVEHLARQMGAKSGRVDPILERLRSPTRGADFARSLWEPSTRAEIQAQAEAALGHTARNWVIFLTSGSTIMLALTVFFLFVYWKKRHAEAAAAERERVEEPWAESLTDQDIRDIYGDPVDSVEDIEEDDDESWRGREE